MARLTIYGEERGKNSTAPVKHTCSIDMLLLIDGSKSMAPRIEAVKEQARRLCPDIVKIMGHYGTAVSPFRVKVIVFRDYLRDGKDAMMQARFRSLPEEEIAFREVLRSVKAFGGSGGGPENGLEACSFAVRSNWETAKPDHRRIFVIWSDSGTHAFDYAKDAPGYPGGMPQTLSELTAWMQPRRNGGFLPDGDNRFVFFTPPELGWTELRAALGENAIQLPPVGSADARSEQIAYLKALRFLTKALPE